MKIILISGKAQSGKDTTAGILHKALVRDGNSVLVTHYADLLKYICKSYFDWDGNKDEKGRKMLQYVGTDVIRKQDPTMWVDFVSKILRYFHDNWDYVIIPDCRFPDEIATMINDGFDTVHLRVVRENFKSPLTEEQQMHPSETALDNVEADYYIANDGTIADLEETITKWMKECLYENAS